MGKKRIITVCLVAALVVSGACAKPLPQPIPKPNPMQGANEVWFEYGEFRPNAITVPAGSTVTWTNKDSQLHTVTSESGLFGETLEPSGRFSYTFTQNGTFNYFDNFDPAHREPGGTVYVK